MLVLTLIIGAANGQKLHSTQAAGANTSIQIKNENNSTVAIPDELILATPQQFINHPEIGVKTAIGNYTNLIELVHKRTENTAYYIKANTQGREFVIHASDKPLHYRDKNGWFKTLSPNLFLTKAGSFVANQQPYPIGFENGNGAFVSLPDNEKLSFLHHLSFNYHDAAGNFHYYYLHDLPAEIKKAYPDAIFKPANFNHLTTDAQQLYFKNFWPGIDLEIRFDIGKIKTNLILQQPILVYPGTDVIISDNYSYPAGYTFSNNKEAVNAAWKVINKSKQFEVAVGKLSVYDNKYNYCDSSNSAEKVILYKTDAKQHTVVCNYQISAHWLNDPARQYPIVIDPEISTGAAATGYPLGASYSTNCGPGGSFSGFCSHDLTVNTPAKTQITDVACKLQYITGSSCTFGQGAMQIVYNTCQTSLLQCREDLVGQGKCRTSNDGGNTIDFNSFWDDFANCMPPPSCTSQPMTFTLRLAQCQAAAPNCAIDCIRSDVWELLITGKTVEMNALIGIESNGDSTDYKICQNDTIRFLARPSNGVPPYKYSWDNAPFSTDSVYFFKGVTTDRVRLMVEDNCGERAFFNKTVEVIPAPPQPEATSNSPICRSQPGSAIRLTATIASTEPVVWRWQGPNSFSANVQNPIINNPAVSAGGFYYVYAISQTTGCTTNVDTVEVKVLDPPNPPTVSPPAVICQGGDLRINASLIPGVSYLWTGPNGFRDTTPNIFIPNATPADSGDYELVVYSAPGCSSSVVKVTAIVRANRIPDPKTANTGPVCEGQPVTITVDSIPGAIFAWTGPSGFRFGGNRIDFSAANVNQAGWYQVVAIANGCSSKVDSTELVIFKNPAIPAGISFSSPACENDTLKLSVNPLAGHTYLWTGPNNFSSTDTAPFIPNVTPAAAGEYSLIAIANNCSSAAAKITLQVNPQPLPPTVRDTITLCEGGTVNLVAGSSQTGVQYLWTGPGNLKISEPNPTVEAQNGYYQCVTIANGCTSEVARTYVRLSTIPPVPTDVIIPATVCRNEPIVLQAITVPNAVIHWKGPNGFSGIGNTVIINNASDINAGDYTAFAVVEGCSSAATAPKNLVVHPLPVPNFSWKQSCTDLSIQIENKTADQLKQIRFFHGDSSIPEPVNFDPATGTVFNFSYSKVGMYNSRIEVENIYDCIQSRQLTVEIENRPIRVAFESVPPPGTKLYIPEAKVQFFNRTPARNLRFQWDFGDSVQSPAANPLHNFEQKGKFNVTLTAINPEGCEDKLTLGPYEIQLDVVLIPSGFSPNGDGMNDIFKVLPTDLQALSIQIFDRWGDLVYSNDNQVMHAWDGKHRNNGTLCPEGAYFYVITGLSNESKPFEYTGSVTLFR
jgi:gliding motility-associated-like protein